MVVEILERREVMSTVSKALEKSTATQPVLRGGFLSLKPSATLWAMGRRAVVQLRWGRKPC